jgi:hypothetical protein
VPINALVTISLDRLVELKAEARGFSFLPRQPVNLPSSSYSFSSSIIEDRGRRTRRNRVSKSRRRLRRSIKIHFSTSGRGGLRRSSIFRSASRRTVKRSP